MVETWTIANLDHLYPFCPTLHSQDATEGFLQFHEVSVIKKYAPDTVIGSIKPSGSAGEASS